VDAARDVHGIRVGGIDLDAQTRCAHWRSPLDVIALKMRCCGDYYACRDCHDALAAHPAAVWPESEWDERAVLCGACGHELTVREYLACDSRCPRCGAAFNPGCHKHRHLYFAVAEP
jgi:uncharacterized CHY-type Zn-finger protein